MMIKNLAQFKRAINEGKAFRIITHYVHPKCTNQIRVPTKKQTNAFYSVVWGEPENPVSKANNGLGYYFPYLKAENWEFKEDKITYLKAGKPVMEIEVLEGDYCKHGSCDNCFRCVPF